MYECNKEILIPLVNQNTKYIKETSIFFVMQICPLPLSIQNHRDRYIYHVTQLPFKSNTFKSFLKKETPKTRSLQGFILLMPMSSNFIAMFDGKQVSI